jgi:hypothetical protein
MRLMRDWASRNPLLALETCAGFAVLVMTILKLVRP